MLKNVPIAILFATIMAQGARAQGRNDSDSQLADLMQSADVIAVADIRGGSIQNDLYSTELALKRVLKGKQFLLPGSTVQVDYPVQDRGPSISAAEIGETGLVFLTSGPSGWRLIPANSSGRGLRSGFLPLNSGVEMPAGEDQSLAIAEAVTRILTAAIETEGPFGELGPKLLVSPHEHPEVYERWSKSDDATLRVYGLTGRVTAGDDSAVVQAARDWPALSGSPRSGLLGSAFSGVRTSSPEAVRALGELATGARDTPGEMRQGLALALAAIHSVEALPFLAKLLDENDSLTRSVVIGGLSAFVTNMRITLGGADAAEAMDEVLNPGQRRTLPDANAPFETEQTRQFLHFGPFRDAVEEAHYVEFWKGWYAQNRSALDK